MTVQSILLSIRPGYCRRILSGEKIVEIRKTRPVLTGYDPPAVYLYETRDGRGAVVGKCICYRIVRLESPKDKYIQRASCLTEREIASYAKGGKYYAWFLKDVFPYQNPRPLAEFGLSRAPQSWRYLKE